MPAKTDTTELRIRNVPKTLHKRLREIALETDTSLNTLVIEALQEYRMTHPKTQKGGGR